MYKDPQDERLKQSRRKWYFNNKKKHRETSLNIYRQKRKFIDDKKQQPCMDCGQFFPPYVMDFDHREKDKKLFTIGSKLSYYGWKKLKQEIAKCDLVCSNCHRIRTFQKLVKMADRVKASV